MSNISNSYTQPANGNGIGIGDYVNGTRPVNQNAFKRPTASGRVGAGDIDTDQPVSQFQGMIYDLFTWKFPRATGTFFVATVSLIFAFHYVNVLRYVLKAAYMLFAGAALVEGAGKLFGANELVSSVRPRRYLTISRESLDPFFDQVHQLSNFLLLEFQRVAFVENLPATVAAFLTSFIGYFLVKYIPIWALLLLTTVTAFTAPLIYVTNQELIDEQLHNLSKALNVQFENTKKLTNKYAYDAAAKARATAGDLQTKVAGYTRRTPPPVKAKGSNGVAHDFPKVPTTDPKTTTEPVRPTADEPLIA